MVTCHFVLTSGKCKFELFDRYLSFHCQQPSNISEACYQIETCESISSVGMAKCIVFDNRLIKDALHVLYIF